jgi:hypothetical protein
MRDAITRHEAAQGRTMGIKGEGRFHGYGMYPIEGALAN